MVAERPQFVMSQLTALSAECHISTLERTYSEMKGQDTEKLAGVLVQSPALDHLDLNGVSQRWAAGAQKNLSGMLTYIKK